MKKPQLFDQKNSVSLNEIDIDVYCFSVLDLKDEIFVNQAKIKEEVIEARMQFLDLKCWLFRKVRMPKPINH